MRYGLRCARHYGKNKHENDPRFRKSVSMEVMEKPSRITVTMRFERWLTGKGTFETRGALSHSDRQKLDLAEKRREMWWTESQTNTAWATFLQDIIAIFNGSCSVTPEEKQHLLDLAKVSRRKSRRKL